MNDRRRASDNSRVERLANSALLAVLARVSATFATICGIPFLTWVTITLFQHTQDIALIRDRMANGVVVDYRQADALRDFALRDQRIARIEGDVKDTNLRIDLIQQNKR
jgi:hypothetical protein